MKKLLLALVLMLAFSAPVFSDVSALVLDCTQDQENGSIIVKTQYKVDGVEVQSRYPVDAQGRYYWVTRYNLDSFAGMTDAEVKTRILKDLQAFGEQLIRKTYFEKANFEFTAAKASKLIGTSGTIATADVLVDTNADGTADTKWIVKTDGIRVEEAIS